MRQLSTLVVALALVVGCAQIHVDRKAQTVTANAWGQASAEHCVRSAKAGSALSTAQTQQEAQRKDDVQQQCTRAEGGSFSANFVDVVLYAVTFGYFGVSPF